MARASDAMNNGAGIATSGLRPEPTTTFADPSGLCGGSEAESPLSARV
jgi:hypothetical protein